MSKTQLRFWGSSDGRFFGCWTDCDLMHLKMVESESTFAYMDATREYIERHGKPVALYSDKHSVFRNNTASAKGDGMTHFGRAMETLNIEIICTNSPQAKGRVERANATLQDRLVKAMRLEGIATIAEANAFLPAYMSQHNARFAKPAFDARDLHRPLASHDDMRVVMVWRADSDDAGRLFRSDPGHHSDMMPAGLSLIVGM